MLKEIKATTMPIMAQVIVPRAVLTFSASPPAVRNWKAATNIIITAIAPMKAASVLARVVEIKVISPVQSIGSVAAKAATGAIIAAVAKNATNLGLVNFIKFLLLFIKFFAQKFKLLLFFAKKTKNRMFSTF